MNSTCLLKTIYVLSLHWYKQKNILDYTEHTRHQILWLIYTHNNLNTLVINACFLFFNPLGLIYKRIKLVVSSVWRSDGQKRQLWWSSVSCPLPVVIAPCFPFGTQLQATCLLGQPAYLGYPGPRWIFLFPLLFSSFGSLMYGNRASLGWIPCLSAACQTTMPKRRKNLLNISK